MYCSVICISCCQFLVHSGNTVRGLHRPFSMFIFSDTLQYKPSSLLYFFLIHVPSLLFRLVSVSLLRKELSLSSSNQVHFRIWIPSPNILLLLLSSLGSPI